ncbi:MAG: transposase, partial [Thermoplasmata archaeon]|nr:transposase [Thermoplasmata archaeon]
MTEENTHQEATGLAWLLKNIRYIQTRIEDFVDEEEEVIEITDQYKFVKKKAAEYLGIEIPPTLLVINSNGCIAMAKPRCPKCNSYEIRKNGTRTRTPQTILGMKIPLRIQKYQCANCKTNFEPEMSKFIHTYQRVTQEAQAFAVSLYTRGISGEEVSEMLEEVFGIKVTATTVRNWAKKIPGEIVETEAHSE